MTSAKKIKAISEYTKMRNTMKWLPAPSDDDVEELYDLAVDLSKLVGRDKTLNDTAEDMFKKGKLSLDEIVDALGDVTRSLKAMPWLITPTYNDLNDGDGDWIDAAKAVENKLKKLPSAKQKLLVDMYKSKKLSLDELLYEIQDL